FLKLSPLPAFFSEPIFKSEFLKIIGALLVLLSQILLAFTLIHFQKSLRFGLNSANTGKLVTTGIFSISRNPFFLSLNIYFLGTAIYKPSIFFMAITFAAIIAIHFFILKEEKFMKENYGNEYKKYTKKVRRYI
ncbi:MAG: isoprenylcysteine carboxylmethyltransferase family protein, partial [Draconibacterium sp.]|nr:isoprenylcysteine carboxylmethyltransferase family protein [Draconibacterium sp.]